MRTDEQQATRGTAQPVETNNAPHGGASRRAALRPFLYAAGAFVLIVAAVYAVRYFQFVTTHSTTDDAYLTSSVIQISPQVNGTVVQVAAHDNQNVKKGDLLLVLDDSNYRVVVQQAKANLDAAIAQAKGAGVSVDIIRQTGSAQVQQAEGGVMQAQSGVTGARSDVAKADATIASARAAAKGADAGVSTAKAGVTAAVAARQRAQDSVGSAQAQVTTSQAAVRAAQANLNVAKANYDRAAGDAKRYAALVAQGAASQQMADQAETAARAAEAQVESAKEQVAQAQATVVQRQADLNAAKQQVQSAFAGIEQANAQLAASKEQATASKAVVRQSQAQFTFAQQSVRQAQAREAQAAAQLKQAETAPRQVAVSQSAQSQAVAKIEQARAALSAAELQLSYTRITAPADGRVSNKTVEVGQLLQIGMPVMAIVPEAGVYVVANYKETQLTDVRKGQPAEIDVDALPGQTYRGHVDSISAATGATFALLPPDNATGNFTKVVQRIPVKIVFESGQPGMDRLRAGMSVVASIKTR